MKINYNREAVNGFLYCIWNGSVRVYEGEVIVIDEERGIFKSKIKRFTCHAEPEKIYNAVVWLKEQDDERAVQLLIDYNYTQLYLACEKVANYENKIQMLRTHQEELKK